MVAICCLVDLVSEWGVLPLRVCYYCFGLYWHERSDWSKLPVSDGWCSWFDSTVCLFIFSAGEGLTEILPPGGYFSLDVVEYHMGHMRLSSVASSLRERSRMRYCSDLAAGLLPNKQTNKQKKTFLLIWSLNLKGNPLTNWLVSILKQRCWLVYSGPD